MKYIFFILLFNLSVGQVERKYEFTTIEHKINGKWECIDRCGDVIFFEHNECETISIITNNAYREFYVLHKMLYVRINSLAYIVDEVDGLRSSIKIIFNEKDRNLELYFYSNRTYENHLRIYLMPCK